MADKSADKSAPGARNDKHDNGLSTAQELSTRKRNGKRKVPPFPKGERVRERSIHTTRAREGRAGDPAAGHRRRDGEDLRGCSRAETQRPVEEPKGASRSNEKSQSADQYHGLLESIPRFTRTNTTVYSDQYHGLLGSIPRFTRTNTTVGSEAALPSSSGRC